jgi:hypothetical protein
MAPKSAHFIYFQVSKYPMMTVPTVRRSEQAEEKKHIADADTVPLQMRLRRARLPESPTPIQEYWVFVAEIIRTNASFGRVLDDLPEACETVACLGTSARWDREANRLAINDRRRSLTSGAIEALSAKDQSHGRALQPISVARAREHPSILFAREALYFTVGGALQLSQHKAR